MRNRKWKRVLPYALVSLYVVLVLCQFLQIRYMQGNQKIMVQVQPNTGAVTFRGAMVDGTWYDASQVTVSATGWTLQEEDDILTNTAGNMLELKLPVGTERTLVFNVGPSEGIVDVSVGENFLQWNLYREETVNYGSSFQLPYMRFGNPVKLGIVALLVCVLLAAIMLMCNIIFEKRRPVDRVVPNRKNPAIEFFRFFISISVVLHHFTDWAPSGYLGVDFFFVVSGFFLMNHYSKDISANKEPARAAVKYTKDRYFRLISYYLLAFFLSLILSVCLWEGRSIDSITDYFWELLMLEGFGFAADLLVGAGWYCSALLIAGLFVYYLLAKYPKTYLYIMAPTSLLLIFSYMLHNFGQLNRWTQFDTFISTGTLRGFAEMGLGCISYQVYDTLRSKNWGNKVISTILELVCFSYMAYIIFAAGPSHKDFVCVFAMAALIVSLFLGKSLWYELLNNRVSYFLGWISIGIYLNHAVIMQRIPWHKVCSHFGLTWEIELLIYLVVVIAFSAISTRFVENVERALKQHS